MEISSARHQAGKREVHGPKPQDREDVGGIRDEGNGSVEKAFAGIAKVGFRSFHFLYYTVYTEISADVTYLYNNDSLTTMFRINCVCVSHKLCGPSPTSSFQLFDTSPTPVC